MLQKWKGKLQCHRFYMKWFHGPLQLPDHHSDARRGWQPYKNMFPRDLQILVLNPVSRALGPAAVCQWIAYSYYRNGAQLRQKSYGGKLSLGTPTLKEGRKLGSYWNGPQSRPKKWNTRRKTSWLGTVFENHRKSLIQHCERSELRTFTFWVDKS